jgi:FkbM family methyltransferase
MAKTAFVFREGAELELRELHRLVEPGQVAVDVGAHYGNYTIRLADLVGSHGRVVAVEPQRTARQVLERNIRLNRLSHVSVASCALGPSTGARALHHHPDPTRASLGAFDEDHGSEPVEVMRLDDLLNAVGVTDVGYLKIDVEGAEVDVLRGATRTIERSRPLIQFEHLPSRARSLGHDDADTWDELAGRGYRLHVMVGSGRLVAVDAPTRPGANYLAVPRPRNTGEAFGPVDAS